MVAEFKLFYNFIELMMENPSPQQVLDLQASPEEEKWIAHLIKRSQEGHLTPQEEADIEFFLNVESAVTLAKTKAFVQLQKQAA